ncbi:MAG: GTP-binding protein [Candidatus Heimdallarchaeota archaeon]|nr:GTP-binding protein [Candidatus Heimdallarchaeota archaeon]
MILTIEKTLINIKGWTPLSFLKKLFRAKKQFKIAVVGLDAAGKTTMLNFLKFEKNIETLPTIGVNVEVLKRENVNLSVFDLGGQMHFRSLWPTLMKGASAIIFVIDAADIQRLDEAKNELWKVLLDPEYIEAPLLIVANKQDLPEALSVSELIDKLDLDNLKKMGKRSWHIQPTIALTGEGVEEAIHWIAIELDKLE